MEDKRTALKNTLNEFWVTQSSSRRADPSSAPQPQPLTSHPVGEDHNPYQQEKEDPPHPSQQTRVTCKGRDEHNRGSSPDSNSNNDDNSTAPPAVRTHATDNGSASDNNDCEDALRFDSKQDSPSSRTQDSTLLSSIRPGMPPCSMKPPAWGKMRGQWEIPLSFHPHDIPTATLASGVTAHAQAPVQCKAEAPQANWKVSPRPAAPMQQEAYDLLADFPALQPPKNPLALSGWWDGNPKTKVAEGNRGLIHSPNHCQETGASHQRRMEYVPHEVSSICAGVQKPVLDLQPFGSISRCNSPTISCEEQQANNQRPPEGNKSAVLFISLSSYRLL